MSIEENDIVISENENLRSYGKARILKIKNGTAKAEFVPHLFSRPPLFSHTKFLKLQEVERIASPLEQLKKEQWDEAREFDLRQMAARFLTANKGGQLSNTRTELLPHQIFTAYEVVKSARRRFLLADDVGLGKTIEAGIIWQALSQREVAKRTLIICPAGLTIQWQEEMQEKFDTFFEIYNRDFKTLNPRIWDLKTCAIASIDTLKREEHKNKLLENRKWDLIIFDEAHKLSARRYGNKLDKTDNFKLAEDLKEHTDALILMTATPHQGEENHSRFVNLLRLLDDDIDFSSLAREDLPLFNQAEVEGKIPYHEYILRTPKMQVTDAEGHKVFHGRSTKSYAFEMHEDERKFYEAVNQYIRKGYSYLERVTDRSKRLALGFVLTTFLKIAASSTAAIRSALRNRKMCLEHKKNLIQESKEDFLDERFEGEYAERQSAFEYGDVFIENEIEEIQRLLDMETEQDVKAVELLKFIDQIFDQIEDPEEQKIVIFTEYRATQDFLLELLEERFGSACTAKINGDLDVDERRKQQLKFRDRDKMHFLVSTESGGEGINLQFAHILFNYDMPWNPMRVEQRVGRIYRYGQDKKVQIYNFRTKQTIEDDIYTYIEEKVERVSKALAKVTDEDPEEIAATMYGEMENEIDYNEVYKRALVEGGIQESKKEIDRGIKKAEKAYKLATKHLFNDVSGYSFERYEKRLKTDLDLSDLERFTKNYLEYHHRRISEENGCYSFLTPKPILENGQLKKKYEKATFDREKAIDHPEYEFLGMGHPFVDSMIHNCGEVNFDGKVADRIIRNNEFSGEKGWQFNFIIRSRVIREAEEEFLFDMHTVFVDADLAVRPELANIAKSSYSYYSAENNNINTDAAFAVEAYKKATDFLKEENSSIWDFEEDVELLNIAFVRFQK